MGSLRSRPARPRAQRVHLERLEPRELLDSTPLNDLGLGLYQGHTGGLYPNGADTRPAALETYAENLAKQIVALDPTGHVDNSNPKSRIGMVSIGISNAQEEFGAFQSLIGPDSTVNQGLVTVNGAQGGVDANKWVDPNAPAWTAVDANLTTKNLTPAQVEVAWVEVALDGPQQYGAFPLSAQKLQNDMEAIARDLLIRYPNIKIAYVSSRTHAYTTDLTASNPEPYAYESGFAVQGLIQDQINGAGNLNYDPSKGAVVAPLILWGPYLWATATPRSDGFTWLQSDLASDNIHASTSGKTKLGQEMQAFFKTDPTATPWFLGALPRGTTGPTVTASASATSGAPGLTVQFAASASGPGTITQYAWTYDDGDFSLHQNPTKTFLVPGTYHVHVTVSDSLRTSTTQEITISISGGPFGVDINGAAAKSPVNVPISLTSTLVNAPASDTYTYAWSVTENGQPIASGSDTSLSFTPADLASYLVNLTVTDQNSGLTGSASQTIKVTPPPPTVTVSPPASAVTGQTLSFTLQATDPSAIFQAAGFTYAINWGDGTPEQTIPATAGNGSGTPVSHAFTAAGSYTVQVTATNQGDATSAPFNLTQAVGLANTLTLVASSNAASVFGQALTFTATVSVVAPGAGTPAGTVQFVIDGAGFGNPVSLTSNNGIFTATSAAISLLGAGPHSIKAIYSGDGNFDTSTGTQAGGQSVAPAPLVITGNNKSMTYGGTLPALSASYQGFVNGDTSASLTTQPTLSTVLGNSPAGSYLIAVSNAVDPNYSISYVNGTLTIAPAALIITAGSKHMVYGSTPPALTAVYQGFVNGDTSASLTMPLTLSTAVTPTSPAGSYPITPSGATDPNYTISFVAGTLKVGQAGTGTTITPSTRNPGFGQLVTLTAVISVTAPGSGSPTGTVQFQVNGNNFGNALEVGSNNGVTSAVLSTATLPLGRLTITAQYSGDSNFVSSLGNNGVLSGTDNQRWVGQAYLDLLNRAVDPFGMAAWTAALSQGGATRTQVALAIEASGEYLTNVVEGYYHTYLRRDADSGGLNGWVAFLAAGGTREQLQTAMVGSAEYYKIRAGSTIPGFLNALYADALGRLVDPSAQALFGGVLAKGVSRGAVAAAIFTSDEYRQDLVRADFQEFLHRPVDDSGLASFVNALRAGFTDQDIIAIILGSGEYLSRV